MPKPKLKIIPIPDPRLVPRYLLEQVKERHWEVDEWYKHQLNQGDENVILGLIDEQNLIKGIIWLTIEYFEKMIFIHVLSVDRQYQSKRNLINFVKNYINELANKLEMNRVLWISNRAKAYLHYGFEESNLKLLEAKPWDHRNRERSKP